MEERKRAEEHKALLIRELHHRVKNTLASVLALLRATAGSAESVETFRDVFSDRILALSRTHSLLVESSWRTAAVADILHSELAPYGADAPERVQLEGSAIELPAELAVPVGMAVHELTTNAAKYGALAVPQGSVEVVWSTDESKIGRVLKLRWAERNGPPVEKPTRTGFGSKLIQQVLTRQCNASFHLNFEREGLCFIMELPLTASVIDFPSGEPSPRSTVPTRSLRSVEDDTMPAAASWES